MLPTSEKRKLLKTFVALEFSKYDIVRILCMNRMLDEKDFEVIDELWDEKHMNPALEPYQPTQLGLSENDESDDETVQF